MKKRKRADEAYSGPTILTNDPSFTAWGWAVLSLDGKKIITTGCIVTEPKHKKLRIRKGDDNVRRINEIGCTLNQVIDKYNVQYVVSEQPHGSQNANAALMVGGTIGILETICVTRKIGNEWYSESDSKNELLGKDSGTKTEMINAVIHHFPNLKLPKAKYAQEAIADALAVYVVAEKQSTAIRFLHSLL